MTDRAGFTQMETALRHHRREDALPRVTWHGHNGTAVTATNKGDHYDLNYVAPDTNDIELMSAMAAVCCHIQGKVAIDNADPELEHKLRRKVATLRTEGAAAVARSYMAAVDLIVGKW